MERSVLGHCMAADATGRSGSDRCMVEGKAMSGTSASDSDED